MPALHFSVVHSAVVVDCGEGGITCTGTEGMTAYVEDFQDVEWPESIYRMQVFRSTDDGVTWTRIEDYVSPATPWFYRLRSPGLDLVLSGGEGPELTSPEMTLLKKSDQIVRSPDGGHLWVPCGMPAEMTDPDYLYGRWGTYDFVLTDTQDVLAVGYYDSGWIGPEGEEVPGPYWEVLRSSDGGATWVGGSDLDYNVDCGAYLGNDVVLLGGANGTVAGLPLLRSTDRGVTWTVIQAPQAYGTTFSNAVVSLGDGVVLVGCGHDLLRSTDAGLTWTSVRSTVPGTWPTLGIDELAVAGVGVVVAMARLNSAGAPAGLWYFSVDAGLTWALATYDPPTDGGGVGPTIFNSPQQLAVADDGAVLATTFNRGPSDDHFRIWRGVWSDAAGLTLAGPCVQAAPPPPPPPPPLDVFAKAASRLNLRIVGTYRPR